MFATFLFWAALGYSGNEPRIPSIISGGPRPEPWRFVRIAIAVVGGIAGGYLSQQFLDPSLAVSGLGAFATGRIFTRVSLAFLNPQPLPPKAIKQ